MPVAKYVEKLFNRAATAISIGGGNDLFCAPISIMVLWFVCIVLYFICVSVVLSCVALCAIVIGAGIDLGGWMYPTEAASVLVLDPTHPLHNPRLL